MRLKYKKVIHRSIVNNFFRLGYTKKSCNAQGSSKYYLFVTAPFLFIINNNKSIENNNTMSIMKLKRREEYERQNYNIKREDA